MDKLIIMGDKIYNKSTGRFVKLMGAVGKKIQRENPDAKRITINDEEQLQKVLTKERKQETPQVKQETPKVEPKQEIESTELKSRTEELLQKLVDAMIKKEEIKLGTSHPEFSEVKKLVKKKAIKELEEKEPEKPKPSKSYSKNKMCACDVPCESK